MPHKSSQPPNISRAKATARELLATQERLNQTTADFLRVDVQTSLTFCKIARETDDPDKKSRNRHHARRGYDTVVRLMRKVDFTQTELQEMNANLEKLKSQLQSLGEVF